MEAVRRWLLWLHGLALLWGRAVAQLDVDQIPITLPPRLDCSASSQKSCEECLTNIWCVWCYTNNTCVNYPAEGIFPPSSLCSLRNFRWGVCSLNFEALIAGLAAAAGLIVVSILICCGFCCYSIWHSRSQLLDDEEEQLARKREERRQQSLQRKHERKLKHDEIRKKYGLLQDSDNPYSRFENE